MYCGKCGAAIREGSIYCGACGAPAGREVAAGEPAPVAAMPPPEPATPSPEPAMPSPEPATPSRGPAIPLRLGNANPALVLTVAGALLIIVGTFLPWVSEGGESVLGLNMPGTNGAIILVLGVLCLAALVLARSRAVGPWSAAMVLLSLLALGLVFHALYIMLDEYNGFPTPSVGYWIAMAGTLVIAAGSALEHWGTPKE